MTRQRIVIQRIRRGEKSKRGGGGDRKRRWRERDKKKRRHLVVIVMQLKMRHFRGSEMKSHSGPKVAVRK